MVKFDKLINKIEEIAPPALALDWDNCGFQIRFPKKEISKVLVCLDVDSRAVKEAIDNKVDLIISHHPLYFNGIKNFDLRGEDDTFNTAKYTFDLLKNEISVYSAHTSFDRAKGGNNEYLAKKIELSDIKFFDERFEGSIGAYGKLKDSITLLDFAKKMTKELGIKPGILRAIGNLDENIKTVGICTGAGMSELKISKKLCCDVFVTGDVKYHEALEAMEAGYSIIDLGHFDSEKFFVDNLAGRLEELFESELEIIRANEMINPFQTINFMI